MLFSLRTLSLLLTLAASFLLSACATGEVKGGLINPAPASQASVEHGVVAIIFMDQTAMKASGLSSFRVGAPQYMVENPALKRAFSGVALELYGLIKSEDVRIRLQSELAKPPLPSLSHIVFIAPRSVTIASNSATADVDIVIRDERSRQLIWKGESTLVSGAKDNNKQAAIGIVRAMRDAQLLAAAP